MTVPSLSAMKSFESRYRVHEFRRVLPGVGRTGRGLVQFWGQRATRRREYNRREEGWEALSSGWKIDPRQHELHTVEISDIDRITDQQK